MMTLANEVTLSQNEVKRINQRYLKARGDAVERMAAMSVMGSTIEELERENAQLRAKLQGAEDELKWEQGKRADLRARVSEIEARYDNVTIALKEKCAELARIKTEDK